MLCPNCGHSAQPGLARCGHCNYKLPETAHPQAAAQTGLIACWNCTHANVAHALRCVQCNAKIEHQHVIKRPAAQGRVQITPNTLSHDE